MTDSSPFSAALAQANLPMLMLDTNGKVTAWNRAMALLSEVEAEQAIGQALANLGPIAAAIADFLGTAQPLSAMQREQVRVNGQTYGILLVGVLGGGCMVMVETPQALREASFKDMMNVVAHELQNPLAAMKGYIELIQHGGDTNQRQQHFIKRAMQAVEDMSELIGRLLDVAWLDSDNTLRLASVNLAYLTKNLADSFMQRAQQQNISLNLQLERVPNVMLEERRIKQVINNLISNAVKYSPDGGEVIIKVHQVDATVLLEVIDQGLGIPDDYKPRIFERFFRVPNQYTRNIGGNGLGLAISYEIVKKHGGELRFESEYGQGSRFYFSLPILALEDGDQAEKGDPKTDISANT